MTDRRVPEYLINRDTMSPDQLAAVLRDPRNAVSPALRAAQHLIAATDAVASETMRCYFTLRPADPERDERLIAVSVDFEALASYEDLWSRYEGASGQMWAAMLARELADGDTGIDFTRTGEVPQRVARAAAEAMLILLGGESDYEVVSTYKEPPF